MDRPTYNILFTYFPFDLLNDNKSFCVLHIVDWPYVSVLLLNVVEHVNITIISKSWLSCSRILFTSQGIVISYLYTIPWQKSLSKVRLEDARDVRLLLSERSFQLEFRGWLIFTFHLNEERVLCTQWEIVCNWFHMMPVEPIKQTPKF